MAGENRGTPLERSPLPPAAKARLRGFWWLHRVWESFREATAELSAALGVPLCVEGCGLCCTSNVPAGFGIEVERAASWLLEQTPALRQQILDRIESWLTRPVLDLEHPMDPGQSIRRPLMGKQPAARLSPVEGLTVLRGRCPLLGDDLRCTIYEVRPLGCRAWGITNQPARWCKRPAGLGEDESHRAVFGGMGTARLRAEIRGMVEAVKGHPKLETTYLFPTALYARFREHRLVDLLPRIPAARLTGGKNVHLPRLFDEALEEPVHLPAEVSS